MSGVPKPDVAWVGAHPNGFSHGRGSVLVEGICLHTTSGGASIGALSNWFNDPKAGVSAHFGIGPGGEIAQYVSLVDTAFAQGIVDNPNPTFLVRENPGINPNLFLVSIEHVDGGVPGTVTGAQLDASQRLAAWLFDAVILPNAGTTGAVVDRDHVLFHSEIGSHPLCPSWPEARRTDYIARVKALLGQVVAPPPIAQPPPVVDFRQFYITELEFEISAADDDILRATIRRQAAADKLGALGVKP